MRKISPVWLPSKEEFANIVKQCNTLGDVLKKLNMSIVGSNYTTLKKRIYKEEINIEHIFDHISLINQIKVIRRISLEKILIENSTYTNSSNLKKRLYKENVLIEQCSKCGNGPEWNGGRLSLHLDHINGNHSDNRLENLRILCPNCHSQTETFGRKIRHPNYCIDCGIVIRKKSIRCFNCNCGFSGERLANGKKRYPKKDWRCLDCCILISRQSDRCKTCSLIFIGKNMMNKSTKIQWPDDKELLQMISESNFVQVGKKLGVSDNAIRKRLKRRKLL